MSEQLTDEQRVKQVYPNAGCYQEEQRKFYVCKDEGGDYEYAISYGVSPAQAWADAASRLPADKPEQNNAGWIMTSAGDSGDWWITSAHEAHQHEGPFRFTIERTARQVLESLREKDDLRAENERLTAELEAAKATGTDLVNEVYRERREKVLLKSRAEAAERLRDEMGAMLLSIFLHVSHGGPTRAEGEALLTKAGLWPSSVASPVTEPSRDKVAEEGRA